MSPLIMAPSPQSTASSNPKPTCTDGDMEIGEPMADCNFPELLARDLETSEAAFTSKAMTAGYPTMGCAAPSVDVPRSFQASVLQRASYRHHLLVNRPQLHSLVIDEADSYVQRCDDGRQRRRVKGGSLDSFSVVSTMEPLSIRTRQQSVTTADTSVSGRCSSLFSHNATSPSPPIQSPCSSNSSPQGTWYEAEADLPQEPASPVSTKTSSVYQAHRAGSEIDESEMVTFQESKGNFGGDSARLDHVHDGRSGKDSRPHTPSAQMHIKKPRIIDILPTMTTPKRTASLKGGRRHVEVIMAPERPRESMTVGSPDILEWQAGYVAASHMEPVVSMGFLSTPNGRTVIDVSGPPPLRGSTSRSQHFHRGRTRSRDQSSLDGNQLFSDGELPNARAYSANLPDNQKPSLADLRSWVDASVETLSTPPTPAPFSPGVPAAGIPLPPEVIESLRVSISCFPETMLLTSSLSIETIRAYSKKFKHQADLDRTLQSNDSQSLYSITSSNNGRPAKRWNLAWLSHNRRSKYQQQQQHHTLPRDMSNFSLGSQTPMTPSWTPIKNIFPNASDYLCDGLYAHLLAYNYITSLCPAPRPVIPVPPKTSYHHRHHPGSRSASVDDTAARNLKIPHKAASLLGMDDPVAATTYLYHQQHQQQQELLSQQRPKTRRLLTRRSNHPLNDVLFSSFASCGARGHGVDGNGAEAPAAMREIQAGLARCISMIVTTLKRTASAHLASPKPMAGVVFGGGGNGVEKDPSLLILEEAAEGVEPVLMRALCEVVRCAEDGVARGI